MKVYVSYSAYCTYSEREEVEYGSWSEDHAFSVNGVSLSTLHGHYHETFDVDFQAAPGDTVYVLVLIYSTGDSFGHSSGNGEILWVFKDSLVAREAEKRWLFACGKHSTDWYEDKKLQSIQFRTDGGEWKQMSNPVYGYSEHLESLTLQQFIIK